MPPKRKLSTSGLSDSGDECAATPMTSNANHKSVPKLPSTPKKAKKSEAKEQGTSSKKMDKENGSRSIKKTKFTKEEDLTIMKYYEDQKTIPALRELMPSRHPESLRVRVKGLFEKWKSLAGT